MSKFSVDLSKFKKVKSDAKTTTLKHPEGHHIVIAHGALSPKMRGAIHALPMADGGDVPDETPISSMIQLAGGGTTKNDWQSGPSGREQTVFAPAPTPKDNSVPNTQDVQSVPLPPEPDQSGYPEVGKGKMMAKGGNVQRKMYADAGGVSSDDSSDDPYPQPTPASTLTPADPSQLTGGASGSWGPTPQPPAQPNWSQLPASQQPLPPPVDKPDQVPASTTGAQQSSSQPQANQPDFLKGFQQGVAGYQNEYEAQTGFNAMQGAAIQQKMDAEAALQKSYTAAHDDLLSQIKGVTKDISDSHIRPNEYLEDMSTPKRISTAIGLIMGGMGAGLTGGPNVPLEFLNRQIDRDVDAQKSNLGRKQTVLSALYHQTDDLNYSTAMARMINTNAYSDQLAQAANMTNDQMAKGRLLAAQSQLNMSKAPEWNNLVLNQALYNHLNGNGSPGTRTEADFQATSALAQKVSPELYKDLQSKYLPGIGVAQKPVPPEVSQKLESYSKLDNILARAENLQKNVYGKGGAWSVDNRADAGNLQRELELNLSAMNERGVRMNPQIIDKISKTIGGVGSVNLGGVAEHLTQLRQTLGNEKQTELNSLAVKPFDKTNPGTAAADFVQRNLNSPDPVAKQQAQQIQQVLQRSKVK